MPPRAKGARLWLRPERRSASGKFISRASWLILDAGRHIATGCAAGEIAAAEARLAEYIASKYRPRRKERDIEEIKIADVLTIYLEDRGDAQSRRNELEERLGRLNEFWGAKTLAEISGETCGAYVAITRHCERCPARSGGFARGHRASCEGGVSPRLSEGFSATKGNASRPLAHAQ